MLMVGETVQFQVRALDAAGDPVEPLPHWVRPRWESEGPGTLEIAPDGAARALAFAETEVSVHLSGLRARTTVRINPARLRLSAPAWYITQGVQNRARAVPLIAGREALLRVFLTGDRPSFYQPRVEALFYRDDALIRGELMEPAFRLLPTEVDESRIDQSFNVRLPGALINRGIAFEIVLDRDRTVPHAPSSKLRIPEHGRLRMDPVQVPRFDLVLVPVVQASNPNDDVRRWVADMVPESDKLSTLRSLLPVHEIRVRVHEGYVTTANLATGAGWGELLGELVYLRIREGERGYYYGALDLQEDAIWDGLGQIGYPASVGATDPVTLTHELGHNLGLRHAPCGGATAADARYPYNGGAIGAWGYDFASQRVVSAALYKDVMGYCDPQWVSDYHFTRAMNFRRFEEAGLMGGGGRGGVAGADLRLGAEPAGEPPGVAWSRPSGSRARTAPSGPALLLWGRVGPDGLVLDPAFTVDLPPALPTAEGPYRLTGTGPAGEIRFDFRFAMRPLEHGGGHFVFALPFDPARDGRLAEIVLTGPGESVVLDAQTSRPMALITDRRDGRLRAVLRDWSGGWPGELSLAPGDAEVVVSEGLPLR